MSLLSLFQHGWTPEQLGSSLAAWFDAADEDTITESGGAVSQWDDKSGNGFDVSRSDASEQPVTGSDTINGYNVITFDRDRLFRDNADVANLFPTATRTFVIAVVEPDVAANLNFIAYFSQQSGGLVSGTPYNGAGGNNLECHYDFAAAQTRAIAEDRSYTTTGLQDAYSATQTNGVPFLYGGEINRTTKLELYAGKDGAYNPWLRTAPGNALNTAAKYFCVGGHGSSDSALDRLMEGKIGEVVIVHDITTEQRLLVEGYLAWKWGLV